MREGGRKGERGREGERERRVEEREREGDGEGGSGTHLLLQVSDSQRSHHLSENLLFNHQQLFRVFSIVLSVPAGTIHHAPVKSREPFAR